MTEPAAARLLQVASTETAQLRRHLLVAAALKHILQEEPIVVGGTAEEFWTHDEYHPTDLDICAPITRTDQQRLLEQGFLREGRHWFHVDVPSVAVEFPDTRIDGDPSRSHVEHLEGTTVRVIGLDDLYLDRLRQLTANPTGRSREYMSAFAIVSARYEDLDYVYIEQRLTQIASTEPRLVEEMRALDRRLNSAARRQITE